MSQIANGAAAHFNRYEEAASAQFGD